MSAAVPKPGPKADETALLPAWFCLEILLHENVMIFMVWELFCHEMFCRW